MRPGRAPTADFGSLIIAAWLIVFPITELRLFPLVLLTVATFVLVRFVVREVRSKAPRLLILGSGPMAWRLIEEIESSRHPRYVVAGLVADARPAAESPAAMRWLGPCDRLTEIVERVRPARIVVAVTGRPDRLPLQSLLESRVRGVEVEDAVEFYERLSGKIAIETLRPIVLIMSKGFRNHGAGPVVARIVSLAVAAVGLVLVAPLLVALAAAVKLDSCGPVLFRHERAGREGRPFGLLKFRTMHPCTEARSEWVVDNIDRITRLGRWLRRFRLDELPQLVNVLRGEMNLIGPRPHPTCNHALFMERIAYYQVRSSVRPGVTGWAQVRHGYANNLDEETEKMRYDLYYIKNRSLWLDMRILVETVGIMIFGQGSSEVRRPSPSRSALVPAPPRRRAGEAAYLPWLAAPGPVRASAGRS